MKKYILFMAAPFLLLSAVSCQQSGSKEAAAVNDTVEAAAVIPPVMLQDVSGSPEYKDATLSIAGTKSVPAGKDSARVSFTFDVKNYNLKEQTPDAAGKNCNNSDKGQHIHFIMDNMPYTALYEPKHEMTLPDNTEHYLMCFLSRSYHESLKQKGAAVLLHFRIDGTGKLVTLDDPKTPMLFYSRPKGDYLGKDTANLLLDYYIWNAAQDGAYKVKAMISNENNGQKKEEMLDTWTARFIKNLGTGKSTVTLTLTDKDGKALEGPNTSVSRTIQLAAQEPLQ